MPKNIIQVEATTVKQLFDELKDVPDTGTFIGIASEPTADYYHSKIVVQIDVTPRV